MATLVLTAVGTAVGGPIGGAIGALIGQQADAALLAPKPRHGPRIGDLAVQTSSYGSTIPKIFGTMRVAGTVIWATELKETRGSSGGGKGRPKVIDYSYSASFAVALSGRRIAGVRRIWADGKLLRGAAGDFKSRTGFRLHLGDEDQAPDPLIASVEGVWAAPAYRGVAYAVFEDLELADFGNRIPSLSFELVGDEAPVSVGAIAGALCEGAVEDGGTPVLDGFAAIGDSVRGALSEAAEVLGLVLRERGMGPELADGRGAVVAIGDELLSSPAEVRRQAGDAVPGSVSLSYHDVDRDYQSGMQRAAAGPHSGAERSQLAAVLQAGQARNVAERRLAALQAGRVTAKVRLIRRIEGVGAGVLVRLPEQAGQWRVQRWTLDGAGVLIDLVRVSAGSLPAQAGYSGRVLGAPDLTASATRLLLLDLPLAETMIDAPRLIALACGEGEGWRPAPLSVSLDDGASWTAVPERGAPAVIGVTTNVLGPGGSALFDTGSVLEVELAHGGMWLEARSDAALANGDNLAVVGGELIQFGSAEPTGPRRFRLSRLLRGRRGTEGVAHQAGEAFALIDRASATSVEVPASAIGTQVRLRADGIGDGPDGMEAMAMVRGDALCPPSPVHLQGRWVSGALHLTWVRRSRLGWDWLSGSDTPLGEEQELYSVTVTRAGDQRRYEVSLPEVVIGAEAAGGGPLAVSVAQVGRFGPSREATIIINEEETL